MGESALWRMAVPPLLRPMPGYRVVGPRSGIGPQRLAGSTQSTYARNIRGTGGLPARKYAGTMAEGPSEGRAAESGRS